MDKNLFKILIVDDEPETRFLHRSLLEEIKNVKVVGEASNSENALYLLVEHYPDLVLLDINMPEKTGIDLVHLIRKRNIDVPVVFISAFEDYAIEAIRNGVYDFLLKPVAPADLKKLIEKHQRLNKNDLPSKLMNVLNSIKEETKIRISSNHSYILINPAEIVYCESEEGYVNVILTNGRTEVSNSSLTQIENQIKNHNFHRLGRSLLLNKDYLRTVNKNSDSCTLFVNGITWTVKASHTSVKELLISNYNYA